MFCSAAGSALKSPARRVYAAASASARCAARSRPAPVCRRGAAPQATTRAAQARQPGGEFVGVGRRRHQHFARHRIGRLVTGRTAPAGVGGAVQLGLLAVELGQELLDQLRFHCRLTGFAWPTGLSTTNRAGRDPAAAHVEHLDRGLRGHPRRRRPRRRRCRRRARRPASPAPGATPMVVAQPGGAFEVELSAAAVICCSSSRAYRSVLPDRSRRSPARWCGAPRR